MSKDYKKLYEEALERAKIFKSPFCQHAAELIFPELRESEDERIRKEIISYIKSSGAVTNSNWISWLEKQCEQKPVEWSEEDEHCIELLLPIIDSSSLITKNRKKCKEFLKSLKDRVLPQPKQELSEEEKAIVDYLLQLIHDSHREPCTKGLIAFGAEAWLKSLRPQNHWKPSEEQMEALNKAKNSPANYYDIRLGLQSLYNDLKKL